MVSIMTHFLQKISTLVIFAGIVVASPVFAAKKIQDAAAPFDHVVEKSGVEKIDFATFIGLGLRTLLSLVGITFLILMVYAGFRWMTARGEEDEIKKSRETIITATIGLIAVLAAYAITTLVTESLLK